MQSNDLLVLHAARHPVAAVQRVGLPLDHPYLECCWLPVLGPSATVFLRRMPVLWQVAEPAEVRAGDLASSLGIESHRLGRSITRLTQFGFARQPADLEVDVFIHVPPLPQRFLKRATVLVSQAHTKLLDDHLRPPASPASPAIGGAAEGRAGVGVYERPILLRSSVARPPLAR